jgi:hypothetical protein
MRQFVDPVPESRRVVVVLDPVNLDCTSLSVFGSYGLKRDGFNSLKLDGFSDLTLDGFNSLKLDRFDSLKFGRFHSLGLDRFKAACFILATGDEL